MFRWDQRLLPRKEVQPLEVVFPAPNAKQLKLLEDLFNDYGVRLTTIAKFMELGFTVSTLVNMTEQEIDDVIKTMLEGYHVELLVGEKYGLKAAIRAERKRQEEEMERQRLQLLAKNGKNCRPDDSVLIATSVEGTVVI